MQRARTRGQSLTELALGLAMVVALILTMRIYIQRSLQARYKVGVDYLFSEIKEHAAAPGSIINPTDTDFTGIKTQYDPYYRESNITETKPEGSFSSVGFPDTSMDQTTTRTGWEKTRPAAEAD